MTPVYRTLKSDVGFESLNTKLKIGNNLESERTKP